MEDEKLGQPALPSDGSYSSGKLMISFQINNIIIS
jgi:hypothetical protein